MTKPQLPDRTSLPEGDVATVLAMFDPGGLRGDVYGRLAIATHLAKETERVATEEHIEAIITELLRRGFIERSTANWVKSECFQPTPLGKKAARLCHVVADRVTVGFGFGGTAKDGDDLETLVIVAIGEGATMFETLDPACCCATTDAVRDVVTRLVDRKFIRALPRPNDPEERERYVLELPAVVRHAQHQKRVAAEIAQALRSLSTLSADQPAGGMLDARTGSSYSILARSTRRSSVRADDCFSTSTSRTRCSTDANA